MPELDSIADAELADQEATPTLNAAKGLPELNPPRRPVVKALREEIPH